MGARRVAVVPLLTHTARLLGTVAVMLMAPDCGVVATLLAGVLLYLAAFAFNHDLAHGALGLPRRLNDLLMTATATVMGISGHGMRLMHQRHHARPLAADDVEGEGATLSGWGALCIGPRNAARYRVTAFVAANQKERRAQVVETALVLVLTMLALGTRSVAGAAWVVVNVTMQLSAAAWASHLPHRPPRALVWLARHLVWTRSTAVLAFVFHLEHHAHPRVPTMLLAGNGATP